MSVGPFLICLPFSARRGGALGQKLPLLFLQLAFAGQLGNTAFGGFLIEVPACEGRSCLQHGAFAVMQPLPGAGQALLGVLPFVAALLEILNHLLVLGTKRVDLFLHLGQGDFRNGEFMLPLLPLVFALANLDLGLLQTLL